MLNPEASPFAISPSNTGTHLQGARARPVFVDRDVSEALGGFLSQAGPSGARHLTPRACEVRVERLGALPRSRPEDDLPKGPKYCVQVKVTHPKSDGPATPPKSYFWKSTIIRDQFHGVCAAVGATIQDAVPVNDREAILFFGSKKRDEGPERQQAQRICDAIQGDLSPWGDGAMAEYDARFIFVSVGRALVASSKVTATSPRGRTSTTRSGDLPNEAAGSAGRDRSSHPAVREQMMESHGAARDSSDSDFSERRATDDQNASSGHSSSRSRRSNHSKRSDAESLIEKLTEAIMHRDGGGGSNHMPLFDNGKSPASVDYTTWRARVEGLLGIGTSPRDTLKAVMKSLKSEPLRLASMVRPHELPHVLRILDRHYQCTKTYQQLMDDMVSVRQTPTETVHDFGARIEIAVHSVEMKFPDAKTAVQWDAVKRDRLVAGLKIEYRMMLQYKVDDPNATFESILEAARRTEDTSDLLKGGRRDTKTPKLVHTKPATANQMVGDPDDPDDDGADDGDSGDEEDPGQESLDGRPAQATDICHSCKKPGHWSRDCPEKTKSTNPKYRCTDTKCPNSSRKPSLNAKTGAPQGGSPRS